MAAVIFVFPSFGIALTADPRVEAQADDQGTPKAPVAVEKISGGDEAA